MTTIPFTDCCTLLGIDPKTLRSWLKQANLLLAAHPTDARLKCLTIEQVQQLATLHGRPLPPLSSSLAPLPEQDPPEREATPKQERTSFSASASEEIELRRSLAALETKVTTLQEQLTQLALQLLREREQHYEQRLMALEAQVQPSVRPCSSPLIFQETACKPSSADVEVRAPRRLIPAELRARSRVSPLIEYGAQGCYVAVCPQEGVLPLIPDSAEWFDWLASLTSFRFVGPQGRFTAYRDSERGQRTRCWTAHRCIHGRHYKHYLGVTDHLTLARLEQMAARLQSHLAAL